MQLVLAQHPVGQTGEGIVVDKVGDSVLGLLLLGEVLPDIVQEILAMVADDRDQHQRGKRLAIGAQMLPLESAAALLIGEADQLVRLGRGRAAIGLHGRGKLGEGAAEQLLGTIQTQYLQGGAVGGADTTILDQQGGLLALVEEGAKATLTFPQLPFRLPACGDVGAEDGDLDDPPLVVENRIEGVGDDPPPAHILEVERLPPLQHLGHGLTAGVEILGFQQLIDVAAQQGGTGPAHTLRQGLVEGEEGPVRVHEEGALRQGVEKGEQGIRGTTPGEEQVLIQAGATSGRFGGGRPRLTVRGLDQGGGHEDTRQSAE